MWWICIAVIIVFIIFIIVVYSVLKPNKVPQVSKGDVSILVFRVGLCVMDCSVGCAKEKG